MMRGSGQQNTTTTVQVAGGVDRSGAVLVLGLGLILVNFIFGSGAPAVAYLFGNRQSAGIPTVSWGAYPLMLLAVFLLLMLAKFGGETGGNLAVLLLAAMWIVWLLNKPDAVGKIFGQSSTKTSGVK